MKNKSRKKLQSDIFSSRIKEVRLALKGKAIDFARILQIKQGTYSNYETASRGISPEFLSRFAETFGVSSHWLLTGEGEMFRRADAPPAPPPAPVPDLPPDLVTAHIQLTQYLMGVCRERDELRAENERLRSEREQDRQELIRLQGEFSTQRAEHEKTKRALENCVETVTGINGEGVKKEYINIKEE